MTLSPQSFELSVERGVATITLSRPERLNALTFEVYGELAATFRALEASKKTRAVVLTGKGRGFCSGGDREKIDLSLAEPAAPHLSDDLLALNDALDKLEQKDWVKAELVKLRYFAGLTMEQTAEALGISPATAHRYWNYARAWLRRAVEGAK